MFIVLDGEKTEVDETDLTLSGYLPMLSFGRQQYYLAPSAEYAGKKARQYYEEMAQNDPREFTCMVGESTLIAWGLGQWAGPGSTSTRNLEDWLDLWLDTPEECWASYDGTESSVDRIGKLAKVLGWEDEAKAGTIVAYRHN